ncbi:MAG: UDP-3-O-(3-hydroxymyristoyl)glucosamine N-acyltransferase [Bdellovibrionota bacterium]
MTLPTTANEIFERFETQGLFTSIVGDAATRVARLSPIEDSAPGDLVFMDKKEYADNVVARKPSVVVTSPKLRDSLAGISGITILIAPNVAMAHALLKQTYSARDFARSGWSGVHSSAVVHASAELDKSVVVEPGAVIGANTKIGKNTRIMAGVIIENDVLIGNDSIVHPRAVVGYGSRLGNEVVVGPGSVIGSEGYGFAQDAKRKSHSIPQTGIVILEDRVRIGAGCCIDRATYKDTKIGAGTKLDNLCHIAHNVQIGEDCLLTSMFCVAGSTKIGDRVIASGQSGVIDHMNICSDAVLLHRAGVTKDIEKPGAYAGLPVQPLVDYMKNSAATRNAHEMRGRIAKLEKHLGLDKDSAT